MFVSVPITHKGFSQYLLSPEVDMMWQVIVRNQAFGEKSATDTFGNVTGFEGHWSE